MALGLRSNAPESRLPSTHGSPMGGSEDRPEDCHTVTYDLGEDDGTTTLTLTQDSPSMRPSPTDWGQVCTCR